MIKLFNTLSKKIDQFEPLKKGQATIYSCGPTVYNHAHIGNLSSYIYADTLRRTLELSGLKVDHVMNFTDVDDKTIKAAHETYADLPPKDALKQLTKHYECIFLDEMALVGNDTKAIKFVRATENIAKMQRLIERLLFKGVAYLAADGIYFSINEYRKKYVYGQLFNINQVEFGQERIHNDNYDKAEVCDFALWKKQKPNEPAWEFTVNGQDFTGRPGWHLECATMSVDNLGQPFDIHTGGVDLIFPHHENEIAEATAGSDQPNYANFFVHNEHLLVDGKKMSKSANNFYTLPDIIKREFDPIDLRLMVLQSHYKSATNFSWKNLLSSRQRRLNYLNIAELRHQIDRQDEVIFKKVKQLISEATAALQNNLDTPTCLKCVSQAFNLITPEHYSLAASQALIDFADQALGLKLNEQTPDITDNLKLVIKKRNQARLQGDFVTADNLRAELLEQGIALNDRAGASFWTRLHP